MDTQGLNGRIVLSPESMNICTLSMLVASVQIYCPAYLRGDFPEHIKVLK